jgi:phospholipase/carboxylesterase
VIPDYFKIVLLTAPIRAVTINFGMKMTSWFDFKDFDIRPDNIEKAISAEEVKESARMINYVLEEEISLLDGKSKNVFIGGFSQGAAMAVHVGIQFP